jgi:hypothetical protein
MRFWILAFGLIFYSNLFAEDRAGQPSSSGWTCATELSRLGIYPTEEEVSRGLHNPAVGRLLIGAPSTWQNHSSLDANTRADLDISALSELFRQTLTPLGHLRLLWRLTHPNLSASEILRTQATFRHLTDQRAEWGALREATRQISGGATSALPLFDVEPPKSFLSLNRSLSNRLLWSGYSLFSLAALPIIFRAHTDPRFAPYAMMLMFAQLGNIHHYQINHDLRKNIIVVRDLFKQIESLKEILLESRDPTLKAHGERLARLLAEDSPLSKLAKQLKRVANKDLAFIGDWAFGQARWSLRSVSEGLATHLDLVAELFDVVAEIDYLTGTTLWIHENSDQLNYPEISEDPETLLELEIAEGHHPYLISEATEVSIPNGFHARLTPTERLNFFLLTGPNMGGKSTFVRMLALNLLLAEMSLPGPFKRMKFRPMHIMTNMDIADSLRDGKSFYDAETDRLLKIVRVVLSGQPTFFGFDEILLGTNSEERQAIEQAIIRFVAKRNNVFILATHDLAMTRLESMVPGLTNIHVEEEVGQEGPPRFTYKVLRGPTPHRNAIRILRAKGFPDEILRDAEEYLRSHGGQK